MVAARIANYRVGDNQHTAGSANLPTLEAARLLNVAERSVRSARAVQERGTPELVAAVAPRARGADRQSLTAP